MKALPLASRMKEAKARAPEALMVHGHSCARGESLIEEIASFQEDVFIDCRPGARERRLEALSLSRQGAG